LGGDVKPGLTDQLKTDIYDQDEPQNNQQPFWKRKMQFIEEQIEEARKRRMRRREQKALIKEEKAKEPIKCFICKLPGHIAA